MIENIVLLTILQIHKLFFQYYFLHPYCYYLLIIIIYILYTR